MRKLVQRNEPLCVCLHKTMITYGCEACPPTLELNVFENKIL